MASLKEVKSRIASVVSTQQITKAMKMVAAAKLRKSQDRIIQMRPFAKKLSHLFHNLSDAGSGDASWYNTVREEKKILIVAISSDRGLCGSFNANVFKSTVRYIQEKYQAQNRAGDITILPIGKKSYEYFRKRNFKVIDAYWNLFHDLSFETCSQIADHIMDSYQQGEFDKVEIVYNEFKNVATQILQIEAFLPITSEDKTKKPVDTDYIYQPDREEIITGIVPKSLRVQLFKAALESNASENGARMTAMDKATDNAGELLKSLRLTYNRTRQAAITKEILEIVGGAEALKSS